MADIAFGTRAAKPPIREATAWDQIRTNRNWLGFWFMLPAMAFLIFFLAYPLGLGIWISFTDARIGRPGVFVGTENYEWLWGDSIFWLSVFNTLLYTTIASAFKFAIGLYLALLLEREHAVQGDAARAGADPLHRADRALRAGVLVDFRLAILDHLMVAQTSWA